MAAACQVQFIHAVPLPDSRQCLQRCWHVADVSLDGCRVSWEGGQAQPPPAAAHQLARAARGQAAAGPRQDGRALRKRGQAQQQDVVRQGINAGQLQGGEAGGSGI